MELRPATAPDQLPLFDTDELRARFLLRDLFAPGEIRLAHTDHDRMVVGGALPGSGSLPLEAPDELRAEFFCQRRELAVVNVGGAAATITCDGTEFIAQPGEVVYVGRGTRDVVLAGDTALYLVSAPAHAEHPTVLVTRDDAQPVALGGIEGSNERVIRKYLHADGAQTCQLVLGITELGTGSMWNTMPPHVHGRRTEIYLYFGLPEDQRVFHVMGEPTETRHLVMADREAVVSPGWSVHCGFGTASYSFVWAMAGENLDYADVEQVPVTEMR